MVQAIIELSRYFFAINISIYAIISFLILPKVDEERKSVPFVIQDFLIFANHIIGTLVLISTRQELVYLFFPVIQMIAVFSFLVLMRAIYPFANRMISTHIAMLLSIGFIMLTRLSLNRAIKQFAIAAVAMVIALIVPVLMKHVKLLLKMRWLFAAVGIGILLLVLVTGSITNGSKLVFRVGGIGFQPSEFIKIIYVLFLAAMLDKATKVWHILLTAVLAGGHVLILVDSRDLGSALIYFITYVVLVFVATNRKRYLAVGMAGAVIASVAAYFLFSHIRVRVSAWLNPWADIEATGYQVAQSLFAIGTGGWFGMGLDSGTPSTIPYVEQDFIFAAICEEFGVVFGIALIAICVNLFLEMVHIAKDCEERFLKLSAYGLGIVYIVQLLLTIGGNCKFIPMTGVTLPLISYGGSSILATMMIFSAMQGFYLNYSAVIHEELPEFKGLSMDVVAGFFSFVFMAMAGYLAHYIYFESPQVINNSYNAKRQEILAAQTIRGDIVAYDGTVLATTIEETQERFYPFGEMFSHVIGYSVNGKMGIEKAANISLVSSDISLDEKLKDDLDEKKHMGNTVYTTFDVSLQKEAYNALGMYHGAVIVTEPTTGKILAMVSKPDFDPNEIMEIWDGLIEDEESSVLVNRATQGLYPPGSTFKLMTALQYIKEHPTEYEDYSFVCNAKYTSGESTINCFHGIKHGKIDFTTSFAKSCNASFSNIGLSLNWNDFSDTLETLYFNRELPVTFPTKKSHVETGSDLDDGVMMQTVIGQGTTQITPLHLAMLTGMVANQGKMMQPYMIERVEAADGKVLKMYEPKSLGQLISQEEALVLQEQMIAVVEEGTATRLKEQNYVAAGKTGSAEFNSSKSDSHAWFTGYTYNTDKPIQVTVIMENAGSGGEYAVPVARRIFDEYYN